MLQRPKCLAQRRKYGELVIVEYNRIISQAEDKINADQLKNLHSRIDAELKQKSITNTIITIKRKMLLMKIALLH